MNELLKPYLCEQGLTVVNPASGVPIATVEDFGSTEFDQWVVAAKTNLPAWSAQTAKQRAAIMRRWYELILQHKTELAELVTAESGKPLAESHGEVLYGASFIEWFSEEGKRSYGDVIPSHAPGKRILVMRQPVGVCVAITPWNFPIAMVTRKVGAALAAGCSIILKPAEATPLSALALEALAHQAGVPKEIFRVITTKDPAAIGKAMCANPTVRKLSFTGSTAVGKILAQQCANTVKRVSLELGGNAPFIVFDDADLDAAVDGFMASKFRNAGQTCVCANRLLVQRGVHDKFIEKLVARVAELKVGDGSHEGVTIGPLINSQAFEKVSGLVENACKQGAKPAIGGKLDSDDNAFYPPTVLLNVESGMDIVNTEIFGPVAPVIVFDEEDEAIKIANDTPYGLAAYFYSQNLARTWRVMEQLEYGMVGVNDGVVSTEVAPFGGIKESGAGREGSKYGLDEYTELKYCLVSGLS